MNQGTTTCSPMGAGIVGAKLERPKGWMVLTDSEKIERLRDIIKQKSYFENRVFQLERMLQKLRSLLTTHSHNGSEVVSKIDMYDSLGGDCAKSEGCSNQKPEEVYF